LVWLALRCAGNESSARPPTPEPGVARSIA
jgi:hypothetical protein